MHYDECDALRVFVAAGKPVFHVEYERRAAASAPGPGPRVLLHAQALRDWTPGAPPALTPVRGAARARRDGPACGLGLPYMS